MIMTAEDFIKEFRQHVDLKSLITEHQNNPEAVKLVIEIIEGSVHKAFLAGRVLKKNE